MGKNKLLLEHLCNKGSQVSILCIDELLSDFVSLPQIRQSGYHFETIPAEGYIPTSRGYRNLLQRRKLARSMRRVLSSHQIDVILLGGDNCFVTFTLVRVARELKIPTVLIPDGFVLPPNPDFQSNYGFGGKFISYWKKLFWRTFHICGPRGVSGVDCILTITRMGRNAMVCSGIDSKRAHIVGSPEYDELAHKIRGRSVEEESRFLKTLRLKLGLPKERPVVFFAHQMIHGFGTTDLKQLIHKMAEATQECNATMLVKFHPRSPESVKQWSQWALDENLGDSAVLFAKHECTSIDAVRVCSALVTPFSTTVLEAMICDKPVILIQYLNIPSTIPYAREYDAAIDANSPEELRKAIIAALTDKNLERQFRKNAQHVLEKELLGLDGKSIQRSVERILNLVQPFDTSLHKRS